MKTHASPKTVHQFAGFDDWFEIFRAGEQTDSQGRRKTFTTADLDSMVANHKADNPAPLVIGHPKNDDPAFGWTRELKRDGNALFAKARPTVPQFEEAVKNEQYPNRSVSIAPTSDGGWRVKHIGFLGAVPPAVTGMPRLQFSEDSTAQVFEFSLSDEDVRPIRNVLRDIGSVMRSLREWFIEKHSREVADDLIPSWQLDGIGRQISTIGETVSQYEKGSTRSETHKEFTMNEQEKLQKENDALKQRNQELEANFSAAEKQRRELEFTAAVNQAQVTVDKMVKDGRVLPAQSVGMAEFIASLPDTEESSFEFSQPATTEGGQPTVVKMDFKKFFNEWLGKLGKQIELGQRKDDAPGEANHNYEAPAGTVANADRVELHNKALEYQAQHKCDYITAVTAVERKQ